MLLEYDPETGHSRCLATGIWFANGVDVSADGSYALFAETFKAAILKHWLEGPKVLSTCVWMVCTLCAIGERM